MLFKTKPKPNQPTKWLRGGKKFLLYLLAPPGCQDLFVIGTILPLHGSQIHSHSFSPFLFLPLFLSLSDKSAHVSGVGFLFEFWGSGFLLPTSFSQLSPYLSGNNRLCTDYPRAFSALGRGQGGGVCTPCPHFIACLVSALFSKLALWSFKTNSSPQEFPKFSAD